MQVAPLPSSFSGFSTDFKISSDYLQKLSASFCPNCKFGDQHLLLKKGRDWELEAWYSHSRWHINAGGTADFADGPDF